MIQFHQYFHLFAVIERFARFRGSLWLRGDIIAIRYRSPSLQNLTKGELNLKGYRKKHLDRLTADSVLSMGYHPNVYIYSNGLDSLTKHDSKQEKIFDIILVFKVN